MLFVSKTNSDNFARNYLDFMEFDEVISKDRDHCVERCREEKEFIWLEWANDLTAHITRFKYDAPVMVRIHDHEIYMDRIKLVNWDTVDIIWFINRKAQEDFNKKMSVSCKQFFLPNAINPEAFSASYGHEKHLGMLSIYFKERKRVERAINVLKRLYEHDNEWRLTIRADYATGGEENAQYYLKCLDIAGDLPFDVEYRMIDLDSYGSEKSDVNKFFADKSVVLSTSDHEGFHYAIAEGALCGCLPVVYNWEWGYARDFWGDYVFDSTKQMANHIIEIHDNIEFLQNKARRFVLDNYHPKVLRSQLMEQL